MYLKKRASFYLNLEFKVGRVLFLSSVGFCVTFWSFFSKILYLELT